MTFRKVKTEANKRLKVICIICKSKRCAGRCRCETTDRWPPPPPKIA